MRYNETNKVSVKHTVLVLLEVKKESKSSERTFSETCTLSQGLTWLHHLKILMYQSYLRWSREAYYLPRRPKNASKRQSSESCLCSERTFSETFDV